MEKTRRCQLGAARQSVAGRSYKNIHNAPLTCVRLSHLRGKLLMLEPRQLRDPRGKTTMKTKKLQKALAWYWRTFPRIFLFLVIIIALFSIIWNKNQEECSCFKMEKAGKEGATHLEAICETLQNQNFTVKRSVMDPLPIPYEYLLGFPPTRKKYLSIGISSVQEKNRKYLLKTIESIFKRSSPMDLKEMVLVVYLANNHFYLNKKTATDIKDEFTSYIESGNLLVIYSSLASYPSLEGLKRSFFDKEKKIQAKSKQNVDYAYLVNFCASLSHYYLMLEDDVICANGFFSVIRQYIEDKNEPWTTVAFSKLGYIGKLYHNEDLPKLARFLLMFYSEMPSDWLLELFYQSKAQKKMITFTPSLFQHIGRISSFHNVENIFKDSEFHEDFGDFGDFIDASCYTDIAVFQDYLAQEVCPPGRGFFWGKNVTTGKTFTMIFQTPIIPLRIQIYTGSTKYPQDILHSGYVEMGKLKTEENGTVTCKYFRKVGDFHIGQFEMDNYEALSEQIDCLRIQVTGTQKEWLRIRKINIWVKKD
ncbi:PREDICTED: alpha-1,3-mannosyl-glycoprotein 4-beta-N-acetylglucosaminyltransferase C-like [Crocodylus porosus]|uniref:alpha-1,3-mannosyl-glycoprotein 4-beta-N-acetylglucosaminyltransferase C-like n=1 Tax=Crocodylus porosus TaxID=8502 RepID=UPI00093A38A4|nr:PREDICTED: alpha-1,3-mannosyl-glycoprotein 4-beta-N-acetylglucosaminyltransferase C-like [Crocodylus porosus]